MASVCSANMDRAGPEPNRTKRKRRRRSQARARSSLKGTEKQESSSTSTETESRTKPWSYRSPSWSVRPKTAVVHLNELQPGLQCELLPETKLRHSLLFCATVDVHGLHFEGKGPAKKQAKLKVGEQALRSFIQFPNASQAHVVMETKTWASVDFTQDQIPDEAHENCQLNHSNKEECSSTYKHKLSVAPCLSPVVLLNRLHPGLKFTCVSERTQCGRRFVMVLKLEGRVFEGCGRSKRLAKARAAASALHSLYMFRPGPNTRTEFLQRASTKQQLPQIFSESISHLVTEKYRELCRSSSSAPPLPHKGLAGIVMTTGLNLRSAQVVAVATGTKYVGVDSISDDRLTVRDCHAEVLSRRALLCFLYAQLETLLREPPDAAARSIFVPLTGSGSSFRLRDDVHFHMFLSCPPCGDARLHCPYQTTAPCMSSRWRYGLRVKVNGGEGTLPLTTQPANQLRGASPGKLPSMSCTDKLAKWCVVGLQGALLSHLVEPIYLHSVTIATLSHTGHMSRVLWRRLAPAKPLQFPYRPRPLLLGCESESCGLGRSELCASGQAVNMAVSWTYGQQGSEIISVNSGLRANSEPSQVCPSAMFTRWRQLHTQISGEETSKKTHSESKMAAVSYQRALRKFHRGVQVAGLGSWTRNSAETTPP